MLLRRGFGLNDQNRGRPSVWLELLAAWAAGTCGTAVVWPNSHCRSTCTASPRARGGRAALAVVVWEAPAPVVVRGAWPGPPVGCTCRRHCNALLDTCNLLHRRAGPGLQLSYHGRPPETCSGRIHYTLRRRRTASCCGASTRRRSCRGDGAGTERAVVLGDQVWLAGWRSSRVGGSATSLRSLRSQR